MFKVVNCSNFDANWSTIIISQFACSKNYHSTESIWTFQFGLRAKKLPLGIIIRLLFSVYKQLSLKKTDFFCAQEEYKNSVSVDEGSQTLALGIMVKLMWLDRILYSAGIGVIHIAYEQYWQPGWAYLRARVGGVYSMFGARGPHFEGGDWYKLEEHIRESHGRWALVGDGNFCAVITHRIWQ